MQSGGLPDVLEEEEPIEEVRVQEEELVMKTLEPRQDCDATKNGDVVNCDVAKKRDVSGCDVIKTTECKEESEELIVTPKLMSPAAKKWKKITNVWRVRRFVDKILTW